MADNYDTTQLALVLESWMIDKLREMAQERKVAAERRMTSRSFSSDDLIELHEMNEIASALSSPEYVN